jgi:hypothetical protein
MPPSFKVKTMHDDAGRVEYQVLDGEEVIGWVWRNSTGWHFSAESVGFKTRKEAVDGLNEHLNPRVPFKPKEGKGRAEIVGDPPHLD